MVYLRALARRHPTADAVLAEMARLRAILTLPKGTVHVVSDVHGEHGKLRHILNNASGSLRPLVETLFQGRLSEHELTDFLSLVYYPRETFQRRVEGFQDPLERRAYVRRAVRLLVEVLRALAGRYSLRAVEQVLPRDLPEYLRELLFAPELRRGERWQDALVDPFVDHRRDEGLLRRLARAVRNLAVHEVIVAGDLGDRGPRIDRVLDHLGRQPNFQLTWGNHDLSWLGAGLGCEALVATVVRLSVRYARLAQLEEGYGIPLGPLEALVRERYLADPCHRFRPKALTDTRDAELLAKMQKAIAVAQWKLEGEASLRNPAWALQHRQLLGALDLPRGTVTIDGTTHPLLDTQFPTLDPSRPFHLDEAERRCMSALVKAFTTSPRLWQHLGLMVRRGSAWLRRDDHLIFHGCVPSDAEGRFLPFPVDGQERAGRRLFDALEGVIRRAYHAPSVPDLDLFWYLWTGPRSPMFGKDRMATFETYLVADKATHHETKDPYFKLLHTEAYCQRVLREFGCDPSRGLIVNGHVPVRPDKGERPLKDSGLAVTIDGAFSEAYGDRGYTLVLEAGRTALAEHHHFDSVEAAVERGQDIVPRTQDLRVFDRPRTVSETETGDALRQELLVLEELLQAYTSHRVEEREPPRG
ncbi:MAG: fructose-bisphosphatase class III [Deltaproteobacteria bacterium]|nr:fructose-bisphosphatase class III [Deltaproteobacteria bacterium]